MCGKGSSGGGGAGALGWGGLAPAQQQTIQASPEALGWYRQAMNLGQQAVSQPYQQFGTRPEDFVAQLNAQQQAAQAGLAGQAASTQPYAAQGAGMIAGAGGANAAQLAANQYMNPYMQQVVSPVQQALQQQQGQQLAQQQAEAIRAGAFGGERAGQQRQFLRGQQELGMGQALSPLYQTGYGQALGAAQTDLARQMQAGQGLIGAGLSTQQASLGAGTLGQQTQQAGIDALRQQFQQQQMWPYMQAQFLGGLAGGLGPLLGQQTYQARAMTPFGGFFEDGGSVDGGEARMGGAVIDAIPGQDYYVGGVAPSGYAKGGVSYAPDDIGGILRSQAEMYGKEPSEYEKMPTGQIQSAKGLEAPNLTSEEQKKTGLKDITGAAKDILGIGKDIYGMFSGKSSSEDGGMGSRAEEDSGYGGLGSLVKTGLSFIPGVGGLANLLPFAEGGIVDRHGYATDGGVMPSDEQLDYVARTMMKEDPRNMEAIGHVIRNRLMSGKYGSSLQDVVTAPKQFTPWNPEMRGTGADPRLIKPTDPTYTRALGAARNVFSGTSEDPTGGALNFYNPKLASPKWGPGMQNTVRIGEHVYGTAPGAGTGLGGARAELAASQRAIPRTDPRRSFMALDESPKAGAAPPAETAGGLGGLLTEQNVIPALMGLGKGLSAMMGAKTVSPGAAFATGLGEGLAGGAESYLGTQKTLAEIPKTEAEAEERRQLARRAAAEVGTETARKGQVEALTKQIGAGTEKVYAEIAGNSVIDVAGIPHMKFIDPKTGTYRIMSLAEWNSLDPSERPSIDPRIVQITKDVQEKTGAGAPSTGAPGAGAALEPPKVGAQTALSVPKEVGDYAQKVAISKGSLSRDTRNKIPDLFSPQIELAKSAEEQKQNLLPLVGALASLPTEKSILTSGKQQEILNPLVSYLAGIARTFGQEDAVLNKFGANPQMLANTEEVKKFVNQMQQTALQNNQLHAFGAFRDLAEGIPSLLNSPGAQRQLASQLLSLNQRQIDKNNVFMDWRRQAAGPRGANAEFAQFTSPEANKFFDDTYSNAFYAPDRENISKMFEVAVPVKGGGSKSLAEVLTKYPNKLTPEYKEYLNKEYPGVLRYFGIR